MIIDVHGHYTTAPEGARQPGATRRSPALKDPSQGAEAVAT